MKENIHPKYHEISVVMTDGTEYKTHSTWGKPGDVMKLDIDPLSHPAWKGGTSKIMEKGQLSKFEKRFGSFLGGHPAAAATDSKDDKKEEK